MFPFWDGSLSPAPYFQTSTTYGASEFDKKAEDFSPYSLISRSTHRTISVQASLRAISEGTCYHQVRMAFHPYSQIIRVPSATPVKTFIPLVGDFIWSTSRSLGFRSNPCDFGQLRPYLSLLAGFLVSLRIRRLSP